ncbi:hypothetical protein IPM65_03380 [Candidatus Roizmanbacteria bacterium]|nr:MAG: hypothetical protein IPM65_03380 [Candidatus Roizmanbacteria bacterium]
MAKKTIDNLQHTIHRRLFSTRDIKELIDLKNELKEWINWLKESDKVTKSEYQYLSSLVEEKVEERSSQFENPLNQVSNFNTSRKKVFSLLLILFALLLVILSLYLIYKPANVEVERSSDGTLPFRGTLKNAEGNPIDTKTDVIFRLYAQPNTGSPLYEGRCIGTEGIEPDYRGEFTVILGSDCSMDPIPEAVLTNEVIFLGVAISTGEEIMPRYRILSSTYSQNSAQVSGKSVGTGTNDIPYLNENGLILIEASDPALKATSGEFTIEGASLSLKTISGGEGNITLQPDAGGYTLIPSGNVGIGIFEPTSKLEIAGLEPYNPIASIKNISIEDSENTQVMSLGLATPSTSDNAKFISFRADVTKEEAGVEVGSIRLNNNGVSYETKGADFAEYFEISSLTEYPLGTIMAISETGISAAKKEEVLVGAISGTAGFIGNAKENTNNSQLIGLVGQIDVLVTNENGPIERGASIGIGTVPGYGISVRATHIVGYALENPKAMQSELCPQEFRSVKDTSGNPIKCGKVKILLRPN